MLEGLHRLPMLYSGDFVSMLIIISSKEKKYSFVLLFFEKTNKKHHRKDTIEISFKKPCSAVYVLKIWPSLLSSHYQFSL